MPVVDFGLRHSGHERGGCRKTFSPFRSRLARLISPSLEAGRTQLGQAEGEEVTVDEYLQEAGLEAWAVLCHGETDHHDSLLNLGRSDERPSVSALLHELVELILDFRTEIAHGGGGASEGKCRPEAVLLAEVRASPSSTVMKGERSRSESRRCHRSEDRRCEWSGSGSDAGSVRIRTRTSGGNFLREWFASSTQSLQTTPFRFLKCVMLTHFICLQARVIATVALI